MDDFELLQAYAKHRAEDAFATLTQRYVNLVYSADLRQTNDRPLAEEVTQAVFLVLARKAESISRRVVLPAWLLRTTRYTAANARRLEQRRHHYETQIMTPDTTAPSDPDPLWSSIAPLLDQTLDRLSEADRSAVILRFFEKQSLQQIARHFNITEDTAQKRVSRALEKMRHLLARENKTITAATLGTLLGHHAVEAAPSALGAAIAGAVLTQSASMSGIVSSLAIAANQALQQAQLRIAAIRIGLVASVIGLLTFVATWQRAEKVDLPTETPPPAELNPLPISHPPQSSPSRQAPGATMRAADGSELLMRAVDATSDLSVSNVHLIVVVSKGSSRITNTFLTDHQGLGTITYPPLSGRWWSLSVEVFRDGYVPKYVSWSEGQQDQPDEIPSAYLVKIDRAQKIGGLVSNEQDEPVAGATVLFSVSGPSVGATQARERLTLMGDYHFERTDASGRWRCHHVPARFGMIDYRLIHPEYQETLYATDSPDATDYLDTPRVREADLVAGQAIFLAKRGIVIAGRVTDEEGRPVPDARVTRDFEFRRPEKNQVTDSDGRFAFGNCQAREISLTAQTTGLAPTVTSFVARADSPELHIVLAAGRLLQGRVVDESDQPIAGAEVEAASPRADSRVLFQWHTKTDADGNFFWDTAPAQQEYAVMASGFEPQERVVFRAETDQQVVRLKRKATAAVRIEGRVVDAVTKAPVLGGRVQLWQTTKEPDGSLSTFTTRPEDIGRDGSFRRKTSSGTVSYILEAQAEGYWPQRLTNQVTSASKISITLELDRSPTKAGQVVTISGEPAATASLVVCGRHDFAQMVQAGKLQIGSLHNGAGTVADGEGRFRLPTKYDPEVVVVAHPSGFAQVPWASVNSNSVITLQPWGRIEGNLQLGGQPVAGATVRFGSMSLRGPESTRISPYVSARSDDAGRFVFEAVPPGEWKIEHEINPDRARGRGPQLPFFSHGLFVRVRSGETATVALGGTGKTVVGKATTAATVSAIVMPWDASVALLTLKDSDAEPPRAPERKHFDSEEAFATAQAAFQQSSLAYWTSPAGRERQRRQREYRVLLAADGSFRLEDIPAGEYTLEIKLLQPPARIERQFDQRTLMASLKMDVSVTDTESADKPVDLGMVVLAPE